MKKRRQHYVWQHYLDGWAVDGRLWCSMRGRRFRASTENVANSRDFYRLKEVSEHDLQWVEALIIRQANPSLGDLARSWIPCFRTFHRVRQEYETNGQANPELERLLDETINNLEEDLHAGIENRAAPILARLRAKDTGLIDDEEIAVDFFWYIASQYFRTPRMARDVVDAVRAIPGFNAEAAWGLMRTIFSTNVGFGFYTRRRALRLTYLDAPQEVEFLTGDQPILNTKAIGLPDGVPPDDVELYYPLTPTLALLIGFDAPVCSTAERVLTVEETLAYNQLIETASYEQVYARSEEVLLRQEAQRSTGASVGAISGPALPR